MRVFGTQGERFAAWDIETNWSTVMGIKVEDIIKEKFIAALENGETPVWRSPYVGCEVAINRVSKKPYRGVNVFFLHGEYASFKQWKELGYTCEKGKGEIAFFNTRTTYAAKDKDGNPVLDKDGNPKMKSGWVLRYYNVWERHNVRNEKGEIAPPVMGEKEIDHTPATELEAKAKAVLFDYMKANGITYREDGENCAYFRPLTKEVHLPFDMISENARVCTLAHECAHSTGAEHLLNRKFGTAYSSHKDTYSREELIAETASAIFCGEMGVRVDFDSTTAYLKSWAKYLHETPAKMIVTAIYQAQRATRLMRGEPLASVKGETENAETTETKEAKAA